MTTQLIDARTFRLRHIAPTATYASEGSTQTILGRTYGFTELPVSHLPTSRDLVEGSYTGRLGDSGEFTLSFPNVAGSKGLWRERFSADRALQFIEIHRDDVLEFVGSIQRVEIDRGVVTVSGTDAWALLRRVYEQDRAWTAAPRDVIEAYTRVPVPLIADDFDGSDLDSPWTATSGSASVADGIARISRSGTGAVVLTTGQNLDFVSDTWRVVVLIPRLVGSTATVQVSVSGAGVPTQEHGRLTYSATLDLVTLLTDDGTTSSEASISETIPPESAGPMTFVIVRVGRWVTGYINGRTLGPIPAIDGVPDEVEISTTANAVGGVVSMDIDSAYATDLQPFLARGSDLGDYVLPGDYPTGGLRGRYFNNADLEGLTAGIRHARIMAPDREPYGERLDTVIDTTGSSAGTLSIPLQPGNAGDYFSVRWFGSVYLRGDLGDYVFETNSVDDGCRLWVGKTAWGDQIIDQWSASSGTTTQGTWDASDHGSEAGWYPIVLEYFDDTGSAAIRLVFIPPGTTYTDPGGTSITASAGRIIPSTSLSPLGCFDNRVQGQSHFDLVQQTAAQFGYDIVCEPKQLESGSFPGLLVPRLRVGTDTDIILEVEDSDAAEPILSPGMTLDGSDQVTTIKGTGAGLPDGRGSQVTADVTDISSLGGSLFDMQAWIDAAGISFPDLLEARLIAELALRATPWEEVRGTPRGQERLADTWPLSQTLSAMRWRAGDGVRLRLPDISVEDTEPRQLLQVTRSFAAEGRTGTQVAFRQRPRSAARSVRGLLQDALASQRAYQRQKETLISAFFSESIAAGAFGGYTNMTLLPGDGVVRAILRIVFNSLPASVSVEINGTDRTSALGGPWSNVPVAVDFTAYATQAGSTDNRLYFRFQNNSGSASTVQAQAVIEVLR